MKAVNIEDSCFPATGKKVIVDDKYVGYITEVYPPCKYHSGRFIVQVHYEFGSDEREFWFSDYGYTVKKS